MADGVERRLAAILVVDAIGVGSRLSEDELGTIREMEVGARQLGELAERYGGRVVEWASDTGIAEFPSAVDAVRCAVEFQQLIAKRLASGETGAATYRAALHLGEVLIQRGRPTGSGLIPAFRMVRFSLGGGLCVSGSVRDQLEGRLNLEWEELGEQTFRGVPLPVRVFRVVTGAEVEEESNGDLGRPRRLAAILEADVVSYSWLMATDGESTVAAVTRHRRTIANQVREHRGRVVDDSGDGLLAEFPSALDAVASGVAIQQELGRRNAELPVDQRLEYRVGVDVGDVQSDGDRIYGSSVNVAARLEAQADPGGIWVSGAVWDQVRYQLDVDADDMGERRLKNIPHPVRAWRVHPDGRPPDARTPARRIALASVALAAVLVVLGLGVWFFRG
jgi:class 3 adenylate cyclase